jgi:hypothetical protein
MSDRRIPMRLPASALIAALALAALAARPAPAGAAEPRDPFPPGAVVTQRITLPADQLPALGKRLNRCTVTSVVNEFADIRGLPVQVNVVTCATEEDARRAETAIRVAHRQRAAFDVARAGLTVVEVARTPRSQPPPLLVKRLLWGRGVLPTASAAYEARFRLACVDALDYGSANRVFDMLLAPDPSALEAEVRALTSGWRFGRTISLAKPARAHLEIAYEVAPKPLRAEARGERIEVELESPPSLLGIPYAEVTARARVGHAYAPIAGPPPGPQDVTATARWPADDPKLRETARGICAPHATDIARVDALLAHVYATIRPGGRRGSRLGVARALELGRGRCWDASDVLVTLCRAAGIPARQLAGWVAEMDSGHVWAEAWVDGRGWLPLDATTPWVGVSDDYVPWLSTSDGEMPLLYASKPDLRRVD